MSSKKPLTEDDGDSDIPLLSDEEQTEFDREMSVREDEGIRDSTIPFLENYFNDIWEDAMNENEDNEDPSQE